MCGFDIAIMMSNRVARGTASLAAKSILLPMAVRGLQSRRRREVASERSYVRSKFEQACASNVVAMLGRMRYRVAVPQEHLKNIWYARAYIRI